MRRIWIGLRGGCAALLCVAGCWTTEPTLRPPKQPEELVVPPSEDPRYSSAPNYPKGTLNNDQIRSASGTGGSGMPNGAPGSGSGVTPRGGARAGGMGGGY